MPSKPWLYFSLASARPGGGSKGGGESSRARPRRLLVCPSARGLCPAFPRGQPPAVSTPGVPCCGPSPPPTHRSPSLIKTSFSFPRVYTCMRACTHKQMCVKRTELSDALSVEAGEV